MNSENRNVAVITGGSQGIGAELVKAYRERDWAVVSSALTVEPSNDPLVLPVAGDISQPGTAQHIGSEAVRAFGRIDTLINDAGVYVEKPFTEYTAEDYGLVTGVNLAGWFTMTQQAIGEMVKRGAGHVVNITSSLADYANSHVPSVLASLTKGGLAAATRSLAIEYASRGIRVNAVSPGVIQTSMRPAESYAALSPDVLPPLGVGQMSDVVSGILFLESSPYITGETLHVDGGQIAGR
jgi:NAD(P)-dependent dehydrogenase (short-subunit alcohol dehydrogenase family)